MYQIVKQNAAGDSGGKKVVNHQSRRYRPADNGKASMKYYSILNKLRSKSGINAVKSWLCHVFSGGKIIIISSYIMGSKATLSSGWEKWLAVVRLSLEIMPSSSSSDDSYSGFQYISLLNSRKWSLFLYRRYTAIMMMSFSNISSEQVSLRAPEQEMRGAVFDRWCILENHVNAATYYVVENRAMAS